MTRDERLTIHFKCIFVVTNYINIYCLPIYFEAYLKMLVIKLVSSYLEPA